MWYYFDQQTEAYSKTANLDSVILILWYQDWNDPIFKFFVKELWKFFLKNRDKTYQFNLG